MGLLCVCVGKGMGGGGFTRERGGVAMCTFFSLWKGAGLLSVWLYLVWSETAI